MVRYEVVSLNEFKANSRIETNDEDEVLEALLSAAENMISRAIRRERCEVEADFCGIPPELRQAVLMLADHLYVNRGATSPVQHNIVPLGIREMILPYVIFG